MMHSHKDPIDEEKQGLKITSILDINVIEHLGQMEFGLAGESTCLTVYCPQIAGATALHYAAMYGHSETVKLLIRAGAATDISDKV